MLSRTLRRALAVGAAGLLLIALGGALVLDAWLEATPLPRAPPRQPAAFLAGLPRLANLAHRGASALAPEHSLSAYRLALAQGADVLELDLRALADGALVVAHDADLRRSHGLERRLDSLSLAELRQRLGALSPRTLAEVFEAFPAARFNLELKDDSLEPPRRLADLIAEHGMQDRVLVASGRHRVLNEFRNLTGGRIATSASAREVLRFVACHHLDRDCPRSFSALQIPVLSWLGLDDEDFVAAAHARGIAVHYFTVDDPEVMRRLRAAGADGIITNRPDRLQAVLAESPP